MRREIAELLARRAAPDEACRESHRRDVERTIAALETETGRVVSFEHPVDLFAFHHLVVEDPRTRTRLAVHARRRRDRAVARVLLSASARFAYVEPSTPTVAAVLAARGWIVLTRNELEEELDPTIRASAWPATVRCARVRDFVFPGSAVMLDEGP